MPTPHHYWRSHTLGKPHQFAKRTAFPTIKKDNIWRTNGAVPDIELDG
jgi:hypothetical protein